MKALVAMCVHRGARIKVLNLARWLEKTKDMDIEFTALDGDALIDRSRSRVATYFVEDRKDCDVLVFIDDDIVYEPETIIKQIKLIREHNLDIVGATYATKDHSKKPSLTFRGLDDKDEFFFGKDGGVREIMYLSTGCMAIHRRVIERMVETNTVHLCHPDTLRFYPFFMPIEKEIKPGKWTYLSEDWAFCDRARELGFKVWVDCSSKLKHIGDYPYDWDDILREPKKVHENIKFSVDITKE